MALLHTPRESTVIQDDASTMVKHKSDVKGSANKRCEMKIETKTKRDKADVDSMAAKRCKKIGMIPVGYPLAKRATVKQSNSKRCSMRVKEKKAKAARILLDTDSDDSSDENSDLKVNGNNRSNLDGKINGEIGTNKDVYTNAEVKRSVIEVERKTCVTTARVAVCTHDSEVVSTVVSPSPVEGMDVLYVACVCLCECFTYFKMLLRWSKHSSSPVSGLVTVPVTVAKFATALLSTLDAPALFAWK